MEKDHLDENQQAANNPLDQNQTDPAQAHGAQNPIIQKIKEFNFREKHKQRRYIALACFAGIFGSVLPWITFPFLGSINGLSLYGKYTLPLFILVLIFSLAGNRSSRIKGRFRIIIPSSICIFLVLFLFFSGVNKMDVFGGFISTTGTFQLGVYMVLLAGIAIPVLLLTVKDPEPTHTAS